MKRVFAVSSAIVLFAVLLLCMSGQVPVYAGAIASDDADNCFFAVVGENAQDIEYTRSPLYNERLDVHGWQYVFDDGANHGYVLIVGVNVNGDIVYEAEESGYGMSPFADCDGSPVYITHRIYLEYRNGAFYDVGGGDALGNDRVADYAARGFGYGGSSAFYEQRQTISYVSKTTTEEYSIQYGLPNYYGEIDDTNCANVAGSVVIGYYDRFCPDLIPGYQTYVKIGPLLDYKEQGSEVIEVQNELYDLMSTDNGQSGTTFAGFQSGMDEYVTDRGYSYETNELMSFGSPDLSAIKSELQSGRPIALFLSEYAFVEDIISVGQTDIVINQCRNAAHVAICCGYRVDTYYGQDGSVSDTRTYLKVVAGLSEFMDSLVYLNLNGLSTINHAISFDIE